MSCARVFLLCMLLSAAGHSAASDSCHAITLSVELSAGDRFERAIGSDLVFRLQPERLGPKGEASAWEMTLTPSHNPNQDYIYPVNPPLRQNGAQILGGSYGEDTKSALGRPHVMRFLLSQADDQHIWPLVENALWPYSAPHPDRAAEEYFNALKAVPTGELIVIVESYDADPTSGSIRRIKVRAEFRAPKSFIFDRALQPKPASCPPPAQ